MCGLPRERRDNRYHESFARQPALRVFHPAILLLSDTCGVPGHDLKAVTGFLPENNAGD